jgi:DNA-binding response OmpR family regulator
MSSELQGIRVLVVEDDPIIALDLMGMLEQAGAIVVGPAYRTSRALALLETEIDVAVLDFRLETETASSIAHRLSVKGIPYLFYTSSRGNPELAHPGVPIIEKPAHPRRLLEAVRGLTRNRSGSD